MGIVFYIFVFISYYIVILPGRSVVLLNIFYYILLCLVPYIDSISKTKTVFNQDRTQFLRIVRIARAIQYCFASEASVMLMIYYMHPL